eukprot:2332635-Pyramimonas_sp.AAC.1
MAGAEARRANGKLHVVKARGQALAAGRSWTDEARWFVLYSGKWEKEEHTNILELRTIVGLLRHASRSTKMWPTL